VKAAERIAKKKKKKKMLFAPRRRERCDHEPCVLFSPPPGIPAS
jgi:hypothetical protein